MEKVLKILFIPFSVVGGVIAGLAGKKLFEAMWGLFDGEEPPDAKTRDSSWRKVLAALAIEGAVFRLVRGLVDRASRQGFARATGTWPGEKRQEPV